MRGKLLYASFGLVVLLADVCWTRLWSSGASEVPFEPKIARLEAAPLCPWREPERDRQQFFPGSVRSETETRILSGSRLELAQRLGRPPAPEENALHCYRIFGPERAMGQVVTRRVKGEYGAIEIVLAVNAHGAVCGVRLQRLREPESVRASLEQTAWLNTFRGKTAHSACQLGRDVPEVPAPARLSAAAVAEGIRSLLILLETASESPVGAQPPHHSA